MIFKNNYKNKIIIYKYNYKDKINIKLCRPKHLITFT